MNASHANNILNGSASQLQLQCLLGVQGQDFVMIAADRIISQSILIMKKDEVKLFNIDGLLVGVNGDSSDMAQFTQYMTRNFELYQKKNHYGLDTDACVHFARNVIAQGWHLGTPKFLNLLLGGCKEGRPLLYSVDFIGSCARVPFAWHGLGGAVSLGVLDHYYRPGMNESEAYEMFSTCVQEIDHRLMFSLPNFQVSLVNKDGVQNLPNITPVRSLV